MADRLTPIGMRNTELDSMPTTAAEVVVGPHTRDNTLSRNSGQEGAGNRIFSTGSAGNAGWTTDEKTKGSPYATP